MGFHRLSEFILVYIILLALHASGDLRWGIVGVWIALDVLLLVRLAALAVRFRGKRWAVVGWD